MKVAELGGPTSGTAEIRFYNQTAKAVLAADEDSSARYEVDNYIYDATSNQLLESLNFMNVVAQDSVENVNVGPLFVYFYNLTLQAGDTIAAFTTTFAESVRDGSEALANEIGQGTKWEKIDVYFN